MTKKEAAIICKKELENPDLTYQEIISETFKGQKSPEEINKLIGEYIQIINGVEAKGIYGMGIVDYLLAPRDEFVESKTKNGVTEINITEGYPKFDPSGKTDVPNSPVSTDIPKFGDESNTEKIEIINPTSIDITPTIMPAPSAPKDVQFPNTESVIKPMPSEPVRSDDFTFGDTPISTPIKNDEPISFPNTESGLHIGDNNRPEDPNNGPKPPQFGGF